MNNFLATGIVRTSHGLKGYVKVMPFSDDYSHFKKIKRVRLFRKEKGMVSGIDCDMDVEDVRFVGNDILIKFSGINSPEEARLFNGAEILVDRKFCSPLGEGEIYIVDLIGLDIVVEKEKVAKVISIYEGSQAPLMEVKRTDGKVFIVPYMAPFVGKPNLNEKTLELLEKDLIS